MPNLYNPDQVAELIRVCKDLGDQLESHRVQLVKTVRRVAWARRAVVFALVVGMLGVVAGYRALDTADDINESRSSQIISSCINFNSQREEIRLAIKKSLLALLPTGTTPTPAQEAIIAKYNDEVDAQLPYRDCSPAGIEKYFEQPPRDPAK